MTPDALLKYKPPLTKKADFDIFWERTLLESKNQPLRATAKILNHPAKKINAYKIWYAGFNGGRICGYFITEKGAKHRPVIFGLHGLPGKKGMIAEYLGWVLSGYNCLSIDVRGQLGESVDGAKYTSGNKYSVAEKGILVKEEYYYRNVYMDCVRAVDFLCERPEVDRNRIAVTGISQGGGLAIATCALDKRPKLCLPDQPYLCHFEKLISTGIVNSVGHFRSFIEDNKDKKKLIFETLSYFDCMNLADRIKARTYMSVGSKDLNCPPATSLAAFNRIKAPKKLAAYKNGTHEWQWYHVEPKMAWLMKNL